jgi:Mn2+/Fe2+ NRAMP family transporter
MSLVFLGYVVSAFLAHPPWATVAREIVRPHFDFTPAFLFSFVAVIGTTISPYMQVFIQSSVVEKGVRAENYRFTKIDVWVGTVFAILIVFFIVISTAATLHVKGEHVESAAQAASALRPLAGPYASILFAVGLFGASMLAAGCCRWQRPTRLAKPSVLRRAYRAPFAKRQSLSESLPSW